MRLAFGKSKPLPDAAPLYGTVVAEMRRPDWYTSAGVADDMDGRFAVLATLMALTDLRLERSGEAAKAIAPRLTERFIADMDAQMREAGFGDPSLGKQVRWLVGALASRVGRWRQAVDGGDWDESARASLYRDAEPAAAEAAVGVAATRSWWDRLLAADDAALIEGRIP